MSYNDKRFPVMDAVCRHRGLCGAIAKKTGVNRNSVWHWVRVPLQYARAVADLTGLPLEVIKAEHAVPLEKFRISVDELKPLPETFDTSPRKRGQSLPHVAEKLLNIVETELQRSQTENAPAVEKSTLPSVANKLEALRRTG